MPSSRRSLTHRTTVAGPHIARPARTTAFGGCSPRDVNIPDAPYAVTAPPIATSARSSAAKAKLRARRIALTV